MNKHNRSYANPSWVAELNINSAGKQVFESNIFPTRIGLVAALLKDLPYLLLHNCYLNDLELVFSRVYADNHKEYAYHRSLFDFIASPCRCCDVYKH